MSYKRKSTSDVLIAGRNIEMTAPYDLETCVKKLARLETNSLFKDEQVNVIFSTRYGENNNKIMYRIVRSVSQNRLRRSMTITGELYGKDFGLTQVSGKAENQYMMQFISVITVIGVIMYLYAVKFERENIGNIFIFLALIPLFMLAEQRQNNFNANYMLELIRDTLE